MRENSMVWLPKEDLENLRPVEGAVPTSLHPRGAEHFIQKNVLLLGQVLCAKDGFFELRFQVLS